MRGNDWEQITAKISRSVENRLREIARRRHPTGVYCNMSDVVEAALVEYFARIDSGEISPTEVLVRGSDGKISFTESDERGQRIRLPGQCSTLSRKD